MALLGGNAFAQDDMYFIPKKVEKVEKAETPKPTYHRGLNVSVDEYNRMERGSSYQIIGKDSLGNDIIEFSQVDSTKYTPLDDQDFYYTSRLGIFDDYYGWYDPWFYGYRGAYWSHFYGPYYAGWYDPWLYPWYDPFYYSWYGPWGYGWYGWYPWYSWYNYGYYSWYNPYYYNYNWYGGGIGYRHTGSSLLAERTNSRTMPNYRSGYTSATHGNFGGAAIANRSYRGANTTASRSAYTPSSNRSGGLRRSGGGNRTYSSGSYSRSSGTTSSSSGYRPSTSTSTYSAPARSTWSSGSSSSSSFSGGGSRSGGGSSSGGSFGGGGSRSGGSFGGGGRGR